MIDDKYNFKAVFSSEPNTNSTTTRNDTTDYTIVITTRSFFVVHLIKKMLWNLK